MEFWQWIIRAVALGAALVLFEGWHSIGVPWAAFFNWMLCMGGAEAIIHTSRVARDRRTVPNVPRRGGRRRTDPVR